MSLTYRLQSYNIYFTGIADISDPCDGTPAIIELADLQSSVDILSPNYDGAIYPNNLDCMWNLKVNTTNYHM